MRRLMADQLRDRMRWGLPARRPRPQDGPALEASERPLIREDTGAGIAYLATDRALHVRDTTEPHAWRRIAWGEVDTVGHERRPPELTLTLADGPVLRLAVAHRSRVPALAAERVAACRVLVRDVRLPDGTRARVRARRVHPGAPVIWSIEPDAEVDAALLAGALAQVRSLTGI